MKKIIISLLLSNLISLTLFSFQRFNKSISPKKIALHARRFLNINKKVNDAEMLCYNRIQKQSLKELEKTLSTNITYQLNQKKSLFSYPDYECIITSQDKEIKNECMLHSQKIYKNAQNIMNFYNVNYPVLFFYTNQNYYNECASGQVRFQAMQNFIKKSKTKNLKIEASNPLIEITIPIKNIFKSENDISQSVLYHELGHLIIDNLAYLCLEPEKINLHTTNKKIQKKITSLIRTIYHCSEYKCDLFAALLSPAHETKKVIKAFKEIQKNNNTEDTVTHPSNFDRIASLKDYLNKIN